MNITEAQAEIAQGYDRVERTLAQKIDAAKAATTKIIAKFQQGVIENTMDYEYRWNAEELCDSAARIHVYSDALHSLRAMREQNNLHMFAPRIGEKLIETARRIGGSTNSASNAMDRAKAEAWATLIEECRWSLSVSLQAITPEQLIIDNNRRELAVIAMKSANAQEAATVTLEKKVRKAVSRRKAFEYAAEYSQLMATPTYAVKSATFDGDWYIDTTQPAAGEYRTFLNGDLQA